MMSSSAQSGSVSTGQKRSFCRPQNLSRPRSRRRLKPGSTTLLSNCGRPRSTQTSHRTWKFRRLCISSNSGMQRKPKRLWRHLRRKTRNSTTRAPCPARRPIFASSIFTRVISRRPTSTALWPSKTTVITRKLWSTKATARCSRPGPRRTGKIGTRPGTTTTTPASSTWRASGWRRSVSRPSSTWASVAGSRRDWSSGSTPCPPSTTSRCRRPSRPLRSCTASCHRRSASGTSPPSTTSWPWCSRSARERSPKWSRTRRGTTRCSRRRSSRTRVCSRGTARCWRGRRTRPRPTTR
mmetsp:Transcript_45121/g.119980  ORF Transcript_45121/g.119980 Transcript_45121/m.119980 type:complete len:295 (+) Transcript_45121:1142-2026(+)